MSDLLDQAKRDAERRAVKAQAPEKPVARLFNDITDEEREHLATLFEASQLYQYASEREAITGSAIPYLMGRGFRFVTARALWRAAIMDAKQRRREKTKT